MGIKIIDVCKTIKKKNILKSVNLSIDDGEVFGLIGANGAGKTTLMKIMCGLSSITEGDIFINDKSINDNCNELCNKIGVLIENTTAYSWMTGLQNLEIIASMYSNIKKQDIIENMKLVGLEDKMNEKFSNYSLGMKQRLGIAQALLNNPNVLILDEPTNGLDIDGVRQMRELIRFLATKKNITVIISSHILDEMDKLCDRAAFIKNGQVVKIVEKSDWSLSSSEEIYVDLFGEKRWNYAVD